MEHPGTIFYNASGILLDESATENQMLLHFFHRPADEAGLVTNNLEANILREGLFDVFKLGNDAVHHFDGVGSRLLTNQQRDRILTIQAR